MGWYDWFANGYDAALDRTYREHRQQARAALQLEPGMTVVDVGCGTGASFDVLVPGVGETGHVVGIDASAGMLRRAARRVRRHGWKQVELLSAEAAAGFDAVRQPIDRVLCFLSLSVIDDWQDPFQHWFEALAPGGRFVVADVHNPRPNLHGRLVEVIAQASLSREVWKPLEEQSRAFRLEWQPSSWTLGGRFFVAVGEK